jgi:hypothetical protein
MAVCFRFLPQKSNEFFNLEDNGRQKIVTPRVYAIENNAGLTQTTGPHTGFTWKDEIMSACQVEQGDLIK